MQNKERELEGVISQVYITELEGVISQVYITDSNSLTEHWSSHFGGRFPINPYFLYSPSLEPPQDLFKPRLYFPDGRLKESSH